MKIYLKYIILLFLIVSCNTSKNIQTIELGLVKFKLPKEAIKITTKNIDSISKLNQKIKELKNIYKIKDIYFAMNDPLKTDVKKDLLEEHKRGWDYDYKNFGFVESQQYVSSLKKINNNETFYMYHYNENIGQYSFKMVNKNRTQILGGTIVFENQSNYDEATKILNDFLKSVQFE